MEIKNQQGSGKNPWHTAFVDAIRMELFDYRDSLEFKYEHPLNTEPLRIDLLIIKKPKDLIIDKNIARIFRADNILEYKSPGDFISVNDYLKVNAYANLYASITPGVDFADLTLTFVEYRHPRKLLEYLKETRGYTVEETSPGIYLVAGDYLPIQIIESGKLSEQENLWLKSLVKDLQASSVESILDKVRKLGGKAHLGAYLYVLMRANPEVFLEAKDMADDDELPTLEEALERAGLLEGMMELLEKKITERILARGLEQGMEQGLARGLEQGKREGEQNIINLLKRGKSPEEIIQLVENC
jgi:hypothetical protein